MTRCNWILKSDSKLDNFVKKFTSGKAGPVMRMLLGLEFANTNYYFESTSNGNVIEVVRRSGRFESSEDI